METIWEICWVEYGFRGERKPLETLLKEGWEPFAVTCLGNPAYALIWLRKPSKKSR